jgi:hypothetical protein
MHLLLCTALRSGAVSSTPRGSFLARSGRNDALLITFFAAFGDCFRDTHKHKRLYKTTPCCKFLSAANDCRMFYQSLSAIRYSNFYRDFFLIPLKNQEWK